MIEKDENPPVSIRFDADLKRQLKNDAAVRGDKISRAVIECVRLGLPLYKQNNPPKYVPVEQVKELQAA